MKGGVVPADEDLFHAWQGGDAAALTALVERYHAPLLTHLVRLVGQRQVAEDLTQETFVRLVREAAAYRYPRPFRPWLYTIARNLARNHWQSGYHRHEAASQDESTGEPRAADAATDPSAWLEAAERGDSLRSALLRLSMEQREVLSLRYGQGLAVEECAAILALPAGTVKSRTFHALRRLRSTLDPEDVGMPTAKGGDVDERSQRAAAPARR